MVLRADVLAAAASTPLPQSRPPRLLMSPRGRH